MWEEFKQFAMRGNVVDLAVGVIIGVKLLYAAIRKGGLRPVLCRREKARSRPRLGPISYRRLEFSYSRVRGLYGGQGHKQIEKGTAAAARGSHSGGKPTDGNSRSAQD